MNQNLKNLIQKLPRDTLTIIRGNSLIVRNGDVHYPFRQDSDFLYLTGLSVPGLALTVRKESENPQSLSRQLLPEGALAETILWREPINEKDNIWGSDKLSDDEMREISGIEEIRDITELENYCSNYDTSIDESVMSTTETSCPEKVSRISHHSLQKQTNSVEMTDTPLWQSIIHELRMIKTPEEIAKIQNCIRITESIYEEVIEKVQPGMYEYEIEALIAHGFRRHHGTEAFPTIVASGPNSCILHYTKNTRQIQSGDIILIDFGIELGGYGADISRTFMVSRGSFGKELSERSEDGGFFPNFLLSHEEKARYTRQREIYNAVEDVKNFAESTLKPGISRKAWNLEVKQYMYDVCARLKLPDIEQYTPGTNPYYPHSIGHFLGLDTHDVGDNNVLLIPGMVLTIEPGIYIRTESIGIRIEDDYLITQNGCVKL